ncbi:MAG: hypothetical protein OEW00_02220 [candidate division Zixibacteria bacterium]|nr:hypothetical protein [candidate division Zixibacteria bacterium]
MVTMMTIVTGKRKLARPWVFLLVVLMGPAAAFGFDRAAIHADRLGPSRPAVNPDTTPLAKDQIGFTATDIADIPISESVSPARFYQTHCAILSQTCGDWLTVWEDGREGKTAIFMQILDSAGVPQGENRLVASSTTGADYVDPLLACDTAGRTFLFYRDRTQGLVYGSVFEDYHVPPTHKFLVNNTDPDAYAGPYDFAVYPNGRIVVVWENYSVMGSTIELKMYSADGGVFLPQITVNTDGGAVDHWVPSVALNPASGFIVTWEDYRHRRADIFLRPYNGGGVPFGPEQIIVPPPANLADQYAPVAVFSAADKFLVGWIDRRIGQEPYRQRFDLTLGMLGGNEPIYHADIGTICWDLDLAVSPGRRFAASWAALGWKNEILAQRFGENAELVGPPV